MKYFFLLFSVNIILFKMVLSQSLSWKSSDLPIKQNSTSIKAVNEKNIWVCGSMGVFQSTDGGATWNQRLFGQVFQAIETMNDSTVFVTQEQNSATVIMRTTNYGIDWQKVHTESTYINGIKMFDQMIGVAIGDPKDSVWKILRTSDGGLHWTQIQNPIKIAKCETGNTNSIAAIGGKYIWFGVTGCGGFKIYKSTDAGISWKSLTTPFDDSYGIWFNDSLNGIVAFGSGYYATSDGGENWIKNSQFIKSTFVVSGIVTGGFWGVSDSAIYQKTNNDSIWTMVYQSKETKFNHLSIFKRNNSLYGWFAGSNGKIVYGSGTITSVDNQKNVKNIKYGLKQNYPNPFNPSTKILYTLPYSSFVTLKVVDALGREIAILENGYKSEGEYRVEFDAQKLPSGIYFYSIRIGEYQETKKLVVIK